MYRLSGDTWVQVGQTTLLPTARLDSKFGGAISLANFETVVVAGSATPAHVFDLVGGE